MAKDAFTTTNTGAEPVGNMLCAHALKLRNELDYYFAALQADWNYCAGRSRAVPAATAALAHAAATAWANCTHALHEIRDVPGAHPHLRSTAGYLLYSVPKQAPTEASLHRIGMQVLQLARECPKAQPGLRALLEEASNLLVVHSANMVVISLHLQGDDRTP